MFMQLITVETLLFTMQQSAVVQRPQRQVKGTISKFNVALQILLDAGASKTAINDNGKTPFDVICFVFVPDCKKWIRTSLERLLRP